MLGKALVFFLVTIIAASFGFGGLAGLAATIAKLLCVVFLSLSLIYLLVSAVHGPTSRVRSR